jgi:PTH1 family peptidyl-tRNA hydrolase
MSGILRRIFGDAAEEPDDRQYPIRLVFALGNPGAKYAGNRRNVGMWVVNRLAKKHGLDFDVKTGTYALAEGTVSGRRIALAKTRTFNNDSGKAAWALVKRLKLDDARELLVVSDHLDLPSGNVRLRRKGGGGGQKGMADVIAKLGSDEFPRVRIGIGRPEVAGEPTWAPDAVADWVLSDPTEQERAVLETGVARAMEAIECAIAEGIDAAMNRYNRDT